MRGKASAHTSPHNKRGITPAYAGKSSQWKINKVEEEDHPRVCGEKNTMRGWTMTPSGSPPRMRGKEVPENTYQLKHRITPAYAGKRYSLISGL